jgi:hypothetical protein
VRLRQRRLMARSAGAIAGVAALAVIANAALTAFRSAERANTKQPTHLLASTTSSTVRQQGEAVGRSQPPDASPAMAAAAAPRVSAAPAVALSQPIKAVSAPVAPHAMRLDVPAGHTALRDSMYVERDADSAVVHFDTEMGRTRRRDKFETTVRATLPLLYGARADSMLATLPEGAITGDRDLVSEVATHGVKLTVPGGGTLDLLPLTRPGRDGPLVVGYRVRVRP